ncbi:hypothetical protein J4573_10095 [Actinomadura barringtoniae]|uniref:Uncharacterized protein n=1 Tax=Actinomadura barringtoniae TaxID=1427535 RepID=A0A939P8P6_9ACTN|nr:hypothetical protein [Actinomadura barringtoniae]MBO2447437.1 hypothetical protein [Actinomadura barringtoniae]
MEALVILAVIHLAGLITGFGMILLGRRRAARAHQWALRNAILRSPGARTCAHDAGVAVDEAAWAEIVERLIKTSGS